MAEATHVEFMSIMADLVASEFPDLPAETQARIAAFVERYTVLLRKTHGAAALAEVAMFVGGDERAVVEWLEASLQKIIKQGL